MIAVAPSILSADFARLGEQVREVEQAGADRIHIDVMDGHFVPNLSMGPSVVKSLRPVTKLPLEVHLMVAEPEKFVESFLRNGADTLIVHYEVLPEPGPLLQAIRQRGRKVGIAIKPDTPVEVLGPFLAQIDLALCMTVYPGFGGQAFIPESLPRLRSLCTLINRVNPSCELEVDGGIDGSTAGPCVDAGATVLVAGTAVFQSPLGAADALRALRQKFPQR